MAVVQDDISSIVEDLRTSVMEVSSKDYEYHNYYKVIDINTGLGGVWQVKFLWYEGDAVEVGDQIYRWYWKDGVTLWQNPAM